MSDALSPKNLITECRECSLSVSAEVVSSYIDKNPYDPMDSERFSFCRCPNCNSPILLKERCDFDEIEGIFWRQPTILFPGNPFHINPEIPERLRKALQESILCYNAKSHTASVIMCRRTIEGFCHSQGVSENNLGKSIKKLHEQGLINNQLYEWANELRLAGNEAAHNIDVEFSALDAKDILDFSIAILDFTFSFKIKFDKFKERAKMSKNNNGHFTG